MYKTACVNNSTSRVLSAQEGTCVHGYSVTQLSLALHDPMGCSPPGFSVHRIFQARILKWVATGDLPNPGIEPRSSASAGRFLTTEPYLGRPSFQQGNLCKYTACHQGVLSSRHPQGWWDFSQDFQLERSESLQDSRGLGGLCSPCGAYAGRR